MPRIDPERLLKCLQPLLEPTSGAIRSTEEVDKILGLMSKFSKKLVSKCIYINILRASHPTVVDLFMERGGWNLVFGWTNDAIANKNYSLLKEIFNLLLTTPVTVPRLKSNRFPIVIKNFSKDCEDEETKNICKQVVSRWITVAKTEEKTDNQQVPAQSQQASATQSLPPIQPSAQQQQLVQAPAVQQQQNSITLIDPSTGGEGELPNLGNMNADHLLNIDPASISMIPDADGSHQNLMDLDLSHSELAGIDFNLDILNKMGVVDNFEETLPQQQQMIGSTNEMSNVVETVSSAPISVIQHAPAQHVQIQQQPQLIHQPPQQQQIILEQHVVQQQQGLHPHVIQHHQQQPQLISSPATTNVILTGVSNAITPVSHQMQQQPQHIQILQQQPQQSQPAHPPSSDPQQLVSIVQMQPSPKIFIKTVAGQRSVVQNFGTDSGQYCLMVKDGKNYLVRLKEQQPVVTTAGNQVIVQQQQPSHPQQTLPPSSEVPDGNNKVPPLVLTQQGQDVSDSGAAFKKVKSQKKDPQLVSPVNKVPGDMKTYSKSKISSPSSSSSSSSSSSKDKKSSENVKPSSDKNHHKSSSSKSKSSNDSKDHHKKSKSSSSANSKAAQAAAQAKEDERLREKIRREKAQMKKRQKEMDKQKQQTEKDQETLKKLNLIPSSSGSGGSSGTGTSTGSNPSGALKIPKIPKRTNSSFADAIGIPGADGVSTADKIKKVSPDKSSSKEKTPNSQNQEDAASLTPAKKFYGKKEEEVAAEQEKKERRHKPKVFVSSKSRSDDLLKEMTESGKGSKSKEKETKDKEEKEQQSGKTANAISLGNSIPATPPKLSKRLSTDSLEKPGDAKKAKIESKDNKVATSAVAGTGKESVKDKIRKNVAATAIVLKESSLFMDAISASSESTKTVKKKRRTSSSGEKDAPKIGELTGTGGNSSSSIELDEVITTPTEEKKPVFNFYRDTLNDEDNDQDNNGQGAGELKKEDTDQENDGIRDVERMEEDTVEDAGSFTPQENDGKVKSALVLVRSRNRKKKNVRWREEDELREYHYFEMDETERVNVTKQKDFTELSSNEKAMEGSFLKRRTEEEEQEKVKPWKLIKILFTKEVLQPQVLSTERAAQEEREKNVLGLFLPPGSILPDSADEPDSTVPSGEKSEPRLIPVEDVNTITKVCDYRTHTWPEPKGGSSSFNMMMGMGRGGYAGGHFNHNQRNQMDSNVPGSHQFPGQNHLPLHSQQFPPQMVPNPASSPTTAGAQDYNPWNSNLGFAPPQNVPPPQAAANIGFGQFGAPVAAAAAMNMMAQGIPPPTVGFPNPFAFPPPPSAMMNGPPPGTDQSGSVIDYGTGTHRNNNNHRGGGSRFDGGNDRRNNFHGGRGDSSSRDRDRRDRDYHREDRGGSRDRDRDYRRGGSNDKDYRNHHDRDRSSSNSRDFRGGGRNIRKEIPCRFFKKGFCSNGSRCEFLHEGGPSSGHSDRGSSRRSPTSDQTDHHHHSSSRHHNSSSSNSNSNEDEDWEVSSNSKDNIPDSAQSPPQEDQEVNPHHQPRTTPSRFSDAPMSPTEDSPSSPVGSFATAGESTKVIPV